MQDLPEQALNDGPCATIAHPPARRSASPARWASTRPGSRVTSGGVNLELTPPDEVRVGESTAKGTTLAMHKRLGWRVAAALLRGAPEAEAIKERAQRYPAKLLLNDKRVDDAKPFPGQLAELRQVKGPPQVTAATPAGFNVSNSRVDLDVLGVLVAQRRVTLPGLQCFAWVRGDELRRNASGSDVVDDDPGLAAALDVLRGISFELLDARVTDLVAGDDPPLRRDLLAMLLKEKLDPKARKLLERAPLLPGPAGEWVSLAELQASVAKGNPVRFATRVWPEGTYEPPAVLLGDDDPHWESLLPKGRRVDVGVAAQARLRAAAARSAWQAQATEPVALPDRAFLATVTVDTPAVRGEVGLLARGEGAFVKLLCEERFVQQGDVPALSPLRLHAVVNAVKPLKDGVWQEGLPNDKLWSLVAQPIEEAVTRVILEKLAEPAMLPHARDLLARSSKRLADVPAPLQAAPLFECLGGERVSLGTLRGEKTWRFTTGRWPWPLLDGSRVLVVDEALLGLLRALSPKKLVDASDQLVREREVRKRLEGPREEPTVRRVFATVPVEAEGVRGEVGVPNGTASRLELTLLRDGFALETTEFHARYGVATAAVDCPALTPNAGWDGAVRDQVFARVLGAVAEAEARLPLAVVAKGTRFADLGAGPRRLLRTFVEQELADFDPEKLGEVQRAVASAPLFTTSRGRALAARRAPPGARAEAPLGRVGGAARALRGHRLAGDGGRRRWPLGRAALRRAGPDRRGLRPRAAPAGGGGVVPRAAEGGHAGARRAVRRQRRGGADDMRHRPGARRRGRRGRGGAAVGPAAGPLPLPRAPAAGGGHRHRRARSVRGAGGGRGEVPRGAARGAAAGARAGAGRAGAARRAAGAAGGGRPGRGGRAEGAVALEAGGRAALPCTDGLARSVDDLAGDAKLQLVRAPMPAEAKSKRPVVVAVDAAVAAGLERWPTAEDVTESLRAELELRLARERVPAVETVTYGRPARWRARLEAPDLDGEVVMAAEGGGSIELYVGKRPLCTLTGELQPPLAAAVNCDALTLVPGTRGVERDAAFKRMLKAIDRAGEALAGDDAAVLAAAQPPLDDALRADLVRLAFWLLRRQRKQKKLPGAKGELPALFALPLLEATDDRTLSVGQLLEAAKGGSVPVSHLRGRLLDPGAWVWTPRASARRTRRRAQGWRCATPPRS